MADYQFDTALVVDPITLQRAAKASVTVYDAADAGGVTPLALKDLNGLPLPNPLTSTAEAFVPAFVTTSSQVKMVGGGLTVYASSYKGLADDAKAAKEFVQGIGVASTATGSPGSSAVVTLDGNKLNFTLPAGPAGKDGGNVLPTDAAVAQAVTDAASSTRGALNSVFETKAALDADTAANVRGSGTATQGALEATYGRLSWQTSRAFDTAGKPRADDMPQVTWAAGNDTTSMNSPVAYRPSVCGTGVKTTTWDGQNDPNFRFFSGTFETNNGAKGDLALNGSIKPDGAAQAARWPVVAAFTTSAGVDKVDVGFYGLEPANAHGVLVEVNGRLVDDTFLVAPSTLAGSGSTATLTFPTKRARTIRIWTGGGLGFYAVRVPAGESISKPARYGRRVAIIGDSYVNGAGASNVFPDQGAGNCETFAPRLARALGFDDIILAGVGGTGWTTAGKFANRVPAVTAMNPDAIIFYGSINDGSGAGTVQTEVQAALDLCASIPKVYVIGPLLNGYSANNAAVKAGTLAKGRTFIDMKDFLYGSGRITAPTGDGNRDLYLKSDGSHPTLDAHRAIARRLLNLMSQ
ncbi:GDSL-type esterase/lipase family protein [Sinomonas susongensis]|uniref:GDSL-type esterase/lipase family protein n=1 Tax=Sinomonas susongensis TaxID=1324851 RepID=UPI0011089A96|nr:GDSL-type esterase/lipase family protein [Sinomonas susongensis]